jgi:DNA-binding CsgD family transcriptional regulator/catechol 2,3-dioxygenase-like lactoylglutathione lyase family enzyme
MAKPGSRRGRPAHPDILTPAEWRVLWLVQHGLSDRQIARMRGTSLEAVKFHRRNIASKVDAAGRRELRFWQRSGAVESEAEVATMSADEVGVTGIGQVSVETLDIERAVAFYRDTLGLAHMFTVPHPEGHMAFFDCDGVRLFVTSHEDRPLEKSSVIYFKVDDIERSYATLTARGVPFEGAPHLIHREDSGAEEWMAFFRDPDENLMALMARIPPQSK